MINFDLENILNKENLQSKLTSDTFIYGINYFKLKVFIESQKKKSKNRIYNRSSWYTLYKIRIRVELDSNVRECPQFCIN